MILGASRILKNFHIDIFMIAQEESTWVHFAFVTSFEKNSISQYKQGTSFSFWGTRAYHFITETSLQTRLLFTSNLEEITRNELGEKSRRGNLQPTFLDFLSFDPWLIRNNFHKRIKAFHFNFRSIFLSPHWKCFMLFMCGLCPIIITHFRYKKL
jgi:hypothetical protein